MPEMATHHHLFASSQTRKSARLGTFASGSIKNSISCGGQGEVFLGVDLTTGLEFAVKVLYPSTPELLKENIKLLSSNKYTHLKDDPRLYFPIDYGKVDDDENSFAYHMPLLPKEFKTLNLIIGEGITPTLPHSTNISLTIIQVLQS